MGLLHRKEDVATRVLRVKCEKLRVSRTSPLIPYLPTCERTSTCDVMGQQGTFVGPTDRRICLLDEPQ